MHFLKVITIAASISAGLLAQDSPASPVQTKRLPPEKSKRKVPAGKDALLDRYDSARRSGRFRVRIRSRQTLPAQPRALIPRFQPDSGRRPMSSSQKPLKRRFR
jgi:hypothetical protein